MESSQEPHDDYVDFDLTPEDEEFNSADKTSSYGCTITTRFPLTQDQLVPTDADPLDHPVVDAEYSLDEDEMEGLEEDADDGLFGGNTVNENAVKESTAAEDVAASDELRKLTEEDFDNEFTVTDKNALATEDHFETMEKIPVDESGKEMSEDTPTACDIGVEGFGEIDPDIEELFDADDSASIDRLDERADTNVPDLEVIDMGIPASHANLKDVTGTTGSNIEVVDKTIPTDDEHLEFNIGMSVDERDVVGNTIPRGLETDNVSDTGGEDVDMLVSQENTETNLADGNSNFTNPKPEVKGLRFMEEEEEEDATFVKDGVSNEYIEALDGDTVNPKLDAAATGHEGAPMDIDANQEPFVISISDPSDSSDAGNEEHETDETKAFQQSSSFEDQSVEYNGYIHLEKTASTPIEAGTVSGTELARLHADFEGLAHELSKILAGVKHGVPQLTIKDLEAQLQHSLDGLYATFENMSHLDRTIQSISDEQLEQRLRKHSWTGDLELPDDRNRARHAFEGSLILLERDVESRDLDIRPLVETIRRDYDDFWSITKRLEMSSYGFLMDQRNHTQKYRDQKHRLKDRWAYFQAYLQDPSLLDTSEDVDLGTIQALWQAQFQLAIDLFEQLLDSLGEGNVPPSGDDKVDKSWQLSDDSSEDNDGQIKHRSSSSEDLKKRFQRQVQRLVNYILDDSRLTHNESKLLQDQIKTFESQVTQLTRYRDLLETQLEEEVSRSRLAQEHSDEYEARLALSEKCLRKALDSVPNDGSTSSSSREDVRKLRTQVKVLEQQLYEASAFIEKQTAQIVETCDDHDRQVEEISLLTDRLSAAVAEISSLKAQYAEDLNKKERTDNSKSAENDSEMQIQELKHRNSELRLELVEINNKILGFETEHILFEDQLSRSQKECNSLEEAGEQKDIEVKALQAQVEVLKQEKSEMQMRTDNTDTQKLGTMHVLQKHVHLLENQLAAAKIYKDELGDYIRAKLQTFDEKISDVNPETEFNVGTILTEIKGIAEKFDINKGQAQELRQQLSRKEEELARKHDEIEDLVETNENVIQKIFEAQAVTTSAEYTIDELQTQIEIITKEKRDWEETAKDCIQHALDHSVDAQAVHNDLIVTRQQLETSQGRINELTTLASTLRSELASAEEKLQAVQADLTETRKEVETNQSALRFHFTAAEKNLEAVQAELTKTKQRLAASERELEATRTHLMISTPNPKSSEVSQLQERLRQAQAELDAERAVPFEEHRKRHNAQLEAAAEARRRKDMGKGKKRTADQLAAEEATKIMFNMDSKRVRRKTSNMRVQDSSHHDDPTFIPDPDSPLSDLLRESTFSSSS